VPVVVGGVADAVANWGCTGGERCSVREDDADCDDSAGDTGADLAWGPSARCASSSQSLGECKRSSPSNEIQECRQRSRVRAG
jgi:hypothetical protein